MGFLLFLVGFLEPIFSFWLSCFYYCFHNKPLKYLQKCTTSIENHRTHCPISPVVMVKNCWQCQQFSCGNANERNTDMPIHFNKCALKCCGEIEQLRWFGMMSLQIEVLPMTSPPPPVNMDFIWTWRTASIFIFLVNKRPHAFGLACPFIHRQSVS